MASTRPGGCIAHATEAFRPPHRGVHRRWVQPLLAELCSGLSDEELPAALAGLLADSALVRSAALAALPSQPSLEAGECPADDAVTAVLWLAQNDPSTGAFQLLML